MANLSYSNVSNLLPKNDFVAQGPLAGALAGMQTMYGVNELNSSARLAEINNQAEQLKLEESQRDVPVNELKRQLNTFDYRYNLDNPALREEHLRSELAKQGVENAYKEAETKNKEITNRAWTVNETLGAFFDPQNNNQEVPGLAMSEYYPQIKAKLESVGVKGLPSVWSQGTNEILKQHFRAASQSVAHIAEMQKQKLTDDAAMARTKEQTRSHEKIAAGNNAAMIQHAQILAAKQSGSPDKDPTRAQAAKAVNDMEAGKPLTMDGLGSVEAYQASQTTMEERQAVTDRQEALTTLLGEKTKDKDNYEERQRKLAQFGEEMTPAFERKQMSDGAFASYITRKRMEQESVLRAYQTVSRAAKTVDKETDQYLRKTLGPLYRPKQVVESGAFGARSEEKGMGVSPTGTTPISASAPQDASTPAIAGWNPSATYITKTGAVETFSSMFAKTKAAYAARGIPISDAKIQDMLMKESMKNKMTMDDQASNMGNPTAQVY